MVSFIFARSDVIEKLCSGVDLGEAASEEGESNLHERMEIARSDHVTEVGRR